MTVKRSLAPILALAALAQASVAQAQQQPCVPAADLGDSIIYALPIAYDAARTSCATRFARDGFITRGGDKFIAGFRARQNAAWPGTFRVLKTMMAADAKNPAAAAGGPEIAALIAAMPEDSLRPFVDGMIGQMIAEEIKPDACGKIERAMELLSPLPVDNVAGLMGFVLEIADIKEPSICPAQPAAAKR